MPSCSNAKVSELGNANQYDPHTPSVFQEGTIKPEVDGVEVLGEEDEEEDVDFNPFLRESPSQEASSSLSSEVDVLDGNSVDSGICIGETPSKQTSMVQTCSVGDIVHGNDENAIQTTLSADGTSEKESRKKATNRKRKLARVSHPEMEMSKSKDTYSIEETNANDVMIKEFSNASKSQKPTIKMNSEDAICTRTRARYSLASFTLDELETFLQETDDEDDLQNVNDEEEYRKFLAAVLRGGDSDGHSVQESGHADDEDEDNDADFEIELEELLESDNEESEVVRTQKNGDAAVRRPETRQNNRRRSSSLGGKKHLAQGNRPLRPILPSFSKGTILPGKTLIPGTTLGCSYPTTGNNLINGFSPQQIGQLHILIHEHMQLLIQVFSLCVLDPSRQHIASQVQGLIFEMLHRRDEVIALRSVPYPTICFSPSYLCPSVLDEVAKFVPVQSNAESDHNSDAQRVCSTSFNSNPSYERSGNIPKSPGASFQSVERNSWMPSIKRHMLSILDVAPLSLVQGYVDDVYAAARECRRRYLESGYDTWFEKEPLFPLPVPPLLPESHGEASIRNLSTTVKMGRTSPTTQQPKKTLAAVLIESTKKQSVALVPKEIAKLAQRFFPFLNPALLPHKPPPAAVVNRVLFTGSEDELLALGLMEYNTDWKAIQQRFLPCKSKNQIFVRQKNCCSSKAPENPIKAVRKMKTSPLTPEEIAYIQEGIKVYKFDWISIWRFIVPHRDPSLLPRQWRIALGTQKSYKHDALQKEKRRLYESKRRKCRSSALDKWRTTSDKEDYQGEIAAGEINGGDTCMDDLGVAYVHQAFLADWRPDAATLTSEHHFSQTREEDMITDTHVPKFIHFREQQSNWLPVQAQSLIGDKPERPSLNTSEPRASNVMGPKHPVIGLTSSTSSSNYHFRPYRIRRVNRGNMVKLAPNLPPVNLPPSVCVVSQAAFKGRQCGPLAKINVSGGGVSDARKGYSVSQIPHAQKVGTSCSGAPSNTIKESVSSTQPELSGSLRERDRSTESGTDSDLGMHPLLFQDPEDGGVPYCPLQFTNGSLSSFSFLSGTQPQLNLSLFHNPHQENSLASILSNSKGSTSMSSCIDFHPLLQKTNGSGFQTDVDATGSLVNSGVQPSNCKSSGPNEKSNELDLEIHLSSTSGREKSMTSKDVAMFDSGRLTTAAISGTTLKTNETGDSYYHQGEKCHTVGCGLHASGGQPTAIPTDDTSRCNLDNFGDMSPPDIVMEQEELSDSEEDIEEHVEFECEEMADSEGEEGSGCEQVDVHNKEVQNAEMGIVSKAGDEKQSEQKFHSDPQVDVCVPVNNIDSPLNTGLISQGKDCGRDIPWLSLDSCAPNDPLLSEMKPEGSSVGQAPSSRNLLACQLGRYKTTETCIKDATEQRHAKDRTQQLTLGPSAFSLPGKTWKHSGKSGKKSRV